MIMGEGPEASAKFTTAVAATEPARWLLATGLEGAALTQTHVLSRALVREAAVRWPGWWNAELFGPPHREADVRLVEVLREGLQRLGLMRRRGRTLRTSPRGRELLQDPQGLLTALAGDLGGGDPFAQEVQVVVTDHLLASGAASHDALAQAALTRVGGGWVGPDGLPPGEHEISAVVSELLWRGEAYGLLRRELEPGGSRLVPTRISFTNGGELVFGRREATTTETGVLVLDADLVGVRGVRARVAVGAHQHLTALHDVIQEAFGWCDDHLYSFWLNNEFYGDEEFEYTSPDMADEGSRTANVPISELELPVGAKIAYVFDFGDDWRVRLTLREQGNPDGGDYPRVIALKGTPPQQYGDPGEV